MAYSELTALARGYPPESQDALLELAERYRLRNEHEILELAAIAADITIDDIVNLGLEPDTDTADLADDAIIDRPLEPDTTRQLLEAFRRYTNKDIDSLAHLSSADLQSYKDSLKGHYFEVMLRDRLNSGETLGELKLDVGQYARLAPPGKEGWDLEIINRRGVVIEELQLKATKDMGEVTKALNKFKNFRVAVPDNLDSKSDKVLGTGVSFQQLTDGTNEQVDAWAEGSITNSVNNAEWSEEALDNALDNATEFAVDIIPIGSALAVVAIEGRQYLTGRATLRQAARSGGQRLARSTAYGTLGTALAATGLGAAAIPAVMGVRLAERRLTGQINLRSNLEDRTADLEFAFSRSHQEASA